MFTFQNRVPSGFGLFIWQLGSVGGTAGAIAKCRQYGIDGVFLKAADGEQTWQQAAKPTIDAFHAAGLSVISWGYVYGYAREPDAAAWALDQGADGWCVDDEVEMVGKGPTVVAYGQALRASHPTASIGFNPYPYPSSQVNQPWIEYNGFCDWCMPQLYEGQDGLGDPAHALATMEADFAHWQPIWRGEGVNVPPLLIDWQGASWSGAVQPDTYIPQAATVSKGKYPLITYWDMDSLTPSEWTAVGQASTIFHGGTPPPMSITIDHAADGSVSGAHETDNPTLTLGSGFAQRVVDNNWERATITVPEVRGLSEGATVAVLRGGARVALTYSPAHGVQTYGDDVVAVVNDLYNNWQAAANKPAPAPVPVKVNGQVVTLPYQIEVSQ